MCPGSRGGGRQAAVEVRMTTTKSLMPAGRSLVCNKTADAEEALGYAYMPEINRYYVSTLRLASAPTATCTAPFVIRPRRLASCSHLQSEKPKEQ
jgi:hypothetical protein